MIQYIRLLLRAGAIFRKFLCDCIYTAWTYPPEFPKMLLASPQRGDRYPMGLSVYLKEMQLCNIYNGGITHNMCEMAERAGIYEALWRPEEIGITDARDLIPLLRAGLAKLKNNPDYFRVYNSDNGWGKYEDFVRFVSEYLEACEENPDAKVEVCR